MSKELTSKNQEEQVEQDEQVAQEKKAKEQKRQRAQQEQEQKRQKQQRRGERQYPEAFGLAHRIFTPERVVGRPFDYDPIHEFVGKYTDQENPQKSSAKQEKTQQSPAASPSMGVKTKKKHAS